MSDFKDIDPDHNYGQVTQDVYTYVVFRDVFLCQLCGTNGEDVHHIVFRSQGGSHKPNNLVLLCGECHTGYYGVHGLKKEVENLLLTRVERNESKFRQRII